jgi:hypothetical protein
MIKQILLQAERDYGVPMTVAGVRKLDRQTAHQTIDTSEAYVAACRRIMRARCVEDTDWRLIAVGWNHVTPSDWVGTARESGQLEEFLEYWCEAAERSGTVGSSYNPEPETAYWAMRSGIPAWVTRALREDVLSRRKTEGPAYVPRKRMRKLIDAARCVRRTSFRPDRYHEMLTLAARAALGRLCPELQRVALESISIPSVWTAIRVRDLPWEAVAKAQSEMAKSPRVRVLWATGRRRESLLAAQFPAEYAKYGYVPASAQAAFYAPAFPKLDVKSAVKIARGSSPAGLARQHGYELTRREAHQWCLDGAQDDVCAWYAEHFGVLGHRSVAVMRWLRRIPIEHLTRSRTTRGPRGEMLEFRLIDKLDEIQDTDVASNPGAMRAFERAAHRLGEVYQQRMLRDHRCLADRPSWHLYRCMRPLLTPAALATEGSEMGHCVGGYASAVEARQSVIISIRTSRGRSTVELNQHGDVLQHRGRNNETPVPQHAALLERWTLRHATRAQSRVA